MNSAVSSLVVHKRLWTTNELTAEGAGSTDLLPLLGDNYAEKNDLQLVRTPSNPGLR